MPAGIQRYERTKMVLPLRVWSDDRPNDVVALQLAHTIDISPIGGRLGGLRNELLPGQTITLERGDHKAAFRVIWTRRLATHENQAGVEALDKGKDIWGVELPQTPWTRSLSTPSAVTQTSSSTLTAKPFVCVQPSPAPVARSPRTLTPAVIPRQALWGLSLALFLLSGFLSLSLYQDMFDLKDSGRVAVRFPLPGAPTADDLARLTPKPRPARSIVVQRISLMPRVQVAEAPTGRIVYPVAPEEGLAGQVKLQVVIAANGIVKQTHVLSGKQVLAQAAAQAVKFWHYRPFHSEDGIPAERETSVVVSFRGTDAVSLQFPSANGNAQVRAN